MRPDKKKRNRGRHTEKSDDAQVQSKNADSKVTSEKVEAAKTNTGESTEQNLTESAATEKSSTSTPAVEVSNDNLPTPNLRRETDALKEEKKPTKRQIFSDWKEYDKPILPEEVEEEQFRDFASLIQQNISEDNYFKFKHERQWENDTFNINKDLFNLNLQELSAGLQCIPFYERLNIPENLFSKNEIKRMETYSKEQEKVYDTTLKSQECNPMYNIVMDKSVREPDIQPEEEYIGAGRDIIIDPILSQSGNLELENELLANCLTSEKQNCVEETPLIQPKESKVTDIQLDFFQSDDKPAVDDNVRKHNIVENQSPPSQEKNASVAETNIRVDTQVKDLEVKHENKEIITESIAKSSDVVPVDTDVMKSSPMDMDSAFESSPLGQRVKPRRSRESKAKSVSKPVSAGEEDKILDSLLSLKEPTISADDSKNKEMEDAENEADILTNDLKSIVIHEKKENLEDWLDSMLDD